MSNSDFRLIACRVLSGLLSALPRTRSVTRVEDLFVEEKKPASPSRRFMLGQDNRPVSLRVADQFDLEVDAVIADGLLGSLGLVHCLPPAGPDKVWVRQRIDQATYLRHLLLEDVRPGTPQAGKSPYAIELVFAACLTGDPAPQRACSSIGEVLREITRDDSYLDAIGINVWPFEDLSSPSAPDAAFRRAFSWLLPCAEAWYARPEAGVVAAPVAPFPLRAMELEDFRVAGQRSLKLDERESLHLVFGHNGSGKSSLCEALELLVTGKIDRLERRRAAEKPDYARILTNRTAYAANRRTKLTLQNPQGEKRAWSIADQGLAAGAPLDPDLAAASFRLDQFLADTLAQGDTAARARLFLRAFFPAVRSALEKFDAAEERVLATLAKLPEHVKTQLANDRGEFDPKRAEAFLPPLAGATVDWGDVLKLLPLPAELLGRLRPLLPRAVSDAMQRTGTLSAGEIEPLIPVIDEALGELAANVESRIETLDHAIKLLEEYGEASVSSLPLETAELGTLMNRWLESLALTDLLEKEHQILSTIEGARRAGASVGGDRAPALAVSMPARPATERKTLLEQARAERDKLRGQVTGFKTASERAAQQGKQLRPLGTFLPEALGEAAQLGAFGEAYRTASPALGLAVRKAFGEHDHEAVDVVSGGSRLVRVGESGWGKELLAAAKRARQTLQEVLAVQAKLADPAAALVKLWPALRQLAEGAKELSGIDQQLLGEFSALVSENSLLGQAINEVMALLTPARWAYQDIAPSVERQGRERLFEVRTRDHVQADLRLNTAELNTFALTLFLLCARRIPNPLRTIVLDDPLQNMDELTVTTVARGLGRLLRLWRAQPDGDGWQLLMLLHSESSLERIRNETACAGYLLPWLSPDAEPGLGAKPAGALDGKRAARDGSDPPRIKPLKSLLKPALQSLEQLFKPIPPPVA